MKALLFIAIIAFSISSCNKKNEVSKDSYEYFAANLKPNMMYADIVATFGTPDGEKGSGFIFIITFLKMAPASGLAMPTKSYMPGT